MMAFAVTDPERLLPRAYAALVECTEHLTSYHHSVLTTDESRPLSALWDRLESAKTDLHALLYEPAPTRRRPLKARVAQH